MKPFFVVGTRPEIIKMAPIIHEFEDRGINPYLLHTGQHYSNSLSSQFFKDMSLKSPNQNLNIGSGTHSEQTAKALIGIEKALIKEKPDVVLVQGDTNAVLSAALAAVKVGIPVGHVEAGLRSYDIRMPEEHNRRLTDHISSYLFAPTEKSAKILEGEKVWGKIFVTGNTVIDALEDRVALIQGRESIASDLGLEEFALLTMHRAENVDDAIILKGLVEGLLSLDNDIVFSAHPRTIVRLKEFNLLAKLEHDRKIHIIEPPGYLEFLALMRDCKFILTDSGGIQEEATAPSINKRVFVLRTSTERPEAEESGHATLVGVDPNIFPMLISNAIQQDSDKIRKCPYGDGQASKRIVNILLKSAK
ncbi:UDP-N-acetylglucosamine 2-epimerase (non-hydrolyzing) [Candidatus Thorarchaeota archaeon]|nr:MAG: UDP-N-acetylglucosamine 2-epimerase (non-hydrolyzing) [Candidatus Thorarchaeota archaeon]